jgi:hypothetical protein
MNVNVLYPPKPAQTVNETIKSIIAQSEDILINDHLEFEIKRKF